MRPLPPQLGPALGALARGQAAGGRMDGRLHGSRCLSRLRRCSEAGVGAGQDAGSAGEGWAETRHHGPASTLPPTPGPWLLAPGCGLFLLLAGAKPAPRHHSGEGTEGARPGAAASFPPAPGMQGPCPGQAQLSSKPASRMH